MTDYQPFYQRFGVRKVSQLSMPPMTPVAKLNLPYLSTYHYVSQSALDKYPQSDDMLFQQYTTPIVLEHVTVLTHALGGPKKVQGVTPQNMVKAFFSHAKRFRQLKNLGAFENAKNTLVVENYGLLNSLYQYPRTLFSNYNRWYNVQATVWDRAASLTQVSRREQFFLVNLPTTLPSVSQLNLSQSGFSAGILHIFHDADQYFLSEVWKWLGESREKSLLSKIPKDKYHLINFIFRDAGRFTVLNLGMLNSWRHATKEELAADEGANKEGSSPVQLQKFFLHFCMSLSEVASVAGDAPEAEALTDDESVATLKMTDDQIKMVTHVAPAEVDSGESETVNPPNLLDGSDTFTKRMRDKIEADLAQLEEVARRVADRRLADAKVQQATALVAEDPHALHTPLEPGIETPTPVVAKPLAPAPNTLKDLTSEMHLTSAIGAPADYSQGVQAVVHDLAGKGVMSAGEERRYLAQAQKYKTLLAPDGQTLERFSVIKAEDLAVHQHQTIPDIATVTDKTMLKSSLQDFDQHYTQHILHKDVCNMVLSIQNAGICVTDYEVEHEATILGKTDNYTIRVNPVEGAPSTFRFKIPHIEEDGTYTSNGTSYRLRKQRGDLPIRKTSPDKVALTSYYGKLFISRSDKRVNDYGHWLRAQVMLKGLDVNDYTVFDMHPNNVFVSTNIAPKLYTALSMGFSGFSVTSAVQVETGIALKLTFNFDYAKREKLYDKDVLKHFEKQGAIVCGITEDATKYVVMDSASRLFLCGTKLTIPLPRLDEMLGLDPLKAPVEFTTMKVLGKVLPLGLILAYYMGLEKLLVFLKARYRRVSVGKRLQLAPTEYALRFEDESLVLNRDDQFATLLVAGFSEFANQIRHYSVYDFNRRGVYLNILEAQGANARYIRELDLLNNLFIDPITKELLVEMQEPTVFQGLLLRSNELLLSDNHPHELDPAHMRIKGYERIAGAVYSELVRSIRAHNGKAGKSRYPIDMHPYAVWKNIAEDAAKNQCVDTNPIQNLKEAEAVTYAGTGGRNARSMVKHTRAFHENDQGTIGEATVDSGDVGINIYTSADPQFTSLRGISQRYHPDMGATPMVSSTALNAPGIDRDDMKRVNFAQIQATHVLACDGYTVNPVRTGYEQVIPHRTGALYATTAKEAGTVVSVSSLGMVVEYQSGAKKAIPLGRQYAAAAGLTVPHEVIAAAGLEAGTKVVPGQILAYNPGFFAPDPLNPKQVAMKWGTTVKVALMESPMTLEDSCMISQKLAHRLKTRIAKPRTIVVNFNQSVSRLVAVGDTLRSEDILCVIEDAASANSGLFDQASLDTLRTLSAQTPTAKYAGAVERIEVYYHGEKEDMSESLQKLATLGDRELAKRHLALGMKPQTGSTDEGFRNDGDPLLLDTMAIRIYLSAMVPMGVGDKGVFSNQLKTVVGEVKDEEIRSESGVEVEAIFGYQSIQARIVESAAIMGTTGSLLKVVGERAVKAYQS